MATHWFRSTGAAALAVAIGLSAGCATPSIPVPPELARVSEEVAVVGRSKLVGMPGVSTSFRIGPYEVTDVDRDWQSSQTALQAWSHRLPSERIQGGYSYRFRGERDVRAAMCVVEADRTEASTTGGAGTWTLGSGRGALRCVCQGRPRGRELEMGLSFTAAGKGGRPEWLLGGGQRDRGRLQAGEHDFALRTLSSVEGKGYVAGEGWKDKAAVPFGETTGLIVEGEGPVGALEVLHPGRAWLARSLQATEREDMACLFAGLLLFESPSGGPP
jgi:hypothetical protein